MGCGGSRIVQDPGCSNGSNGNVAATSVSEPAHVHSFVSEQRHSSSSQTPASHWESSAATQQRSSTTHVLEVDVLDLDGSPRPSNETQYAHRASGKCGTGSAPHSDHFHQPGSKIASRFTTVATPPGISSAVSLNYLLDQVLPRTEELALDLGVTEVSAGTFWDWVIRPISEDAGHERRQAPLCNPALSLRFEQCLQAPVHAGMLGATHALMLW